MFTKSQFDLVSKMTKKPKCFVFSSSPGTGKTIAFGIAALDLVDRHKHYPQVLCLCSTYETAIQTQNILCRMAAQTGIAIGCAVQDGHGKFH